MDRRGLSDATSPGERSWEEVELKVKVFSQADARAMLKGDAESGYGLAAQLWENVFEGKAQVASIISTIAGKEIVWALLIAQPGVVNLQLHLPVTGKLTDAEVEEAISRAIDRMRALWTPLLLRQIRASRADKTALRKFLIERTVFGFSKEDASITHYYPQMSFRITRTLKARIENAFREEWQVWIKVLFMALREWVRHGCKGNAGQILSEAKAQTC